MPRSRCLIASLVCALPAAAQGVPAREITLYGRVLDVLRAGVPAAEVFLANDDGKVIARTTADGEGVFLLQHLPATTLSLHARGEGKVEGVLRVPTTGPSGAASIVLEDGAALHGTVSGPDGSPIVGAHVVAFAEEPLEPPLDWHGETVTDAKGNYVLAAAPLRCLIMRAWAPGAAMTDVPVLRRDDAAADLVLPPGPPQPRQVQVTGLPAGVRADVVVHLPKPQEVWTLPAPLRSASVRADGSASLWPLAVFHEVSLEVTASHRGCPVGIPCRPGAAVALAFAVEALPPDLIAPRTELAGCVIDGLGHPLRDVRVLSAVDGRAGESAVTDRDGRFRIVAPVRAQVLCQLGLAPGSWELADPRAELGTDGIHWTTLAANPAASIRLHAQPAPLPGSIRGVALDPSGARVPGAEVVVYEIPYPGKRCGGWRTASDAAGNVEITGMRAGRYGIIVNTIHGPGKTEIEVLPGGKENLGPLHFEPAGAVAGVVRDPDGSPVAGAVLVFQPGLDLVHKGKARYEGGPVLTDRNGRFRALGVRAGTWRVVVQDGERAGRRGFTQVEVEAGTTTAIDLDTSTAASKR